MTVERPRVGIGIMIFRDDNVLLAKRKGSHGAGEYAFPGGHLEFGESFEHCARRETREEADIEIKDIQFQLLANIKKYGGKHYVHIGLIAKWASGEPRLMEPDKSAAWEWYALDALPEPMFEACKLAVQSYKTGQNYFDS